MVQLRWMGPPPCNCVVMCCAVSMWSGDSPLSFWCGLMWCVTCHTPPPTPLWMWCGVPTPHPPLWCGGLLCGYSVVVPPPSPCGCGVVHPIPPCGVVVGGVSCSLPQSFCGVTWCDIYL